MVPQPVTTPSPAGCDGVHPELGAAMGDEHVEFLEAVLVQQQLDPLARCQLALGVLRVDAALSAPCPRHGAAHLDLLQDVFHGPLFPLASVRAQATRLSGRVKAACPGRADRTSDVQHGVLDLSARRRYIDAMSYSNARFLDRTTPPHIVTLVLLAGVSAMSMSVFLPSLPRMTEEFGTSYGVMQLSVSLYLACTALLQIVIGPVSDRYGRRPVVLGALAIFVLATIGCWLSTSAEMFLTFRMIQAAVAVGMVLSRAIVRDCVPQDEAASMIGYVTMGMSLVPMFAPMVGGLLDEAFGWRTTFLFTALCGAGLMALCWVDQGETHAAETRAASAPRSRNIPSFSRRTASGDMPSPPPSRRAVSSRFSAGLLTSRRRCSACPRG